MVVTGAQAGTMWNDQRVDLRGIWPVMSAPGRGMTFAEWLQVWVDDPRGHAARLS
jgi:hypothetical protein